MKGASASRASRRAISVLPTPVGPIIRMFFGVISVRIGSATCWRRQRFLSAIATARFALPCPTMYLSSSWTISCGVIPLMSEGRSLQYFDRSLLIRVNADLARNAQGLVDDLSGQELAVVQKRPRRCLR